MLMNRRLTRCRENRMLAGVASGVAEYFSIDPSFVRLVWFASIFFGGLGILLYVAMIFIVPLEPLSAEAAAAHAAAVVSAPQGHLHRQGSGWLMTAFGVVLLVIGGIALLQVVLPGWASWRQIWPLLFIGAGGFLLSTSMRRQDPSVAPMFATGGPAASGAPVTATPVAEDPSTPADDEATTA
jgi:phage shock protein PspC (stress-responsive transcriptional regulator)